MWHGWSGIVASLVLVSVGLAVSAAPEPTYVDGHSGSDNPGTVVVAVLDYGGVNAYHPHYRAVGERELNLDRFVNTWTGATPRPVSLTTDLDWPTAVDHDQDVLDWGPGEVVHFEGTRILGVHFGTTLERYTGSAHGDAMTWAVLNEYPGAVVVKPASPSQRAVEWIEWVVDQPWIDVITLAFNIGLHEDQPNGLPSPFRPAIECTVAEHTDSVQVSDAVKISRLLLNATRDGKIVVQAAGNGPWNVGYISPIHGPPWIWGVSGSDDAGRAKSLMSENVWPDFVANYTIEHPRPRTTQPETMISAGTSFASPATAGVVSRIIHGLRETTGHTGGIMDGEVAPGFIADDVRAALNKTALLDSSPQNPAGIDDAGLPYHTHPPGAESLTAHWGHVDARIVEQAVHALVSGDLDVPEEKAATALWKGATYESRIAYWAPWEEDCG